MDCAGAEGEAVSEIIPPSDEDIAAWEWAKAATRASGREWTMVEECPGSIPLRVGLEGYEAFDLSEPPVAEVEEHPLDAMRAAAYRRALAAFPCLYCAKTHDYDADECVRRSRP